MLKFKKQLNTLVVAFLFSLLCTQSGLGRPRAKPVVAEKHTLEILNCHDGDTCKAKNEEGLQLTLRLLGVDAPEVGSFSKKGKKGQAFGAESRDYLRTQVVGKKIRVDLYGHDVYRRYLALLYAAPTDAKSVNEKLVEEGYAFAYSGKSAADIKAWAQKAQTVAQAKKKGLWGLDNPPQDPSIFRKSQRGAR